MIPLERIQQLQARIKARDELKIQLTATDYKVIKAYEYQLAGLDAPYDIAELHTQREAIREQIRQLEE